MIKKKKIGAIIPAAGKGKRMGAGMNKQFIELEGKPIIARTLETFQAAKEIDSIILVTDPIFFNELNDLILKYNLSKVISIVEGGNERQDSVWNGLKALLKYDVSAVMIHDAVRPFITTKLIRNLSEAVLKDEAVIVAVKPKDTVKVYNEDNYLCETISRDRLWLAQTPQAFSFSLIYSAFEKAMKEKFYGTDDASLVERLGKKVRIIEGTYDNIKITTPEDIELATLILKRQVTSKT